MSARNGNGKPPPDVDLTPPYSEEAEDGVLGCVLLAPAEVLSDCEHKFGDISPMFYDARNRILFRTIQGMRDIGIPVDTITVHQKLKDTGTLEKAGGYARIAQLPDKTPSAANIDYYLEIMREKHVLRGLLKASAEIAAMVRAFGQMGDIEALAEKAERSVLKAASLLKIQADPTIRDLVHQAMEDIERLHGSKGQVTGLATGLADIDKCLDGMQAGNLVVLGGLPGRGKTALAMNIAHHVAIKLKQPVGVFSIEMPAKQIVTRLICSEARVNLHHIRDGFLSDREFARIVMAAGGLSQSPMNICDISDLTILQLKARARRMAQEKGVKLIVVDYIQLLSGSNARNFNREQEISEISRGLKSLSKELSVPVLALSQINRELETSDRKPTLRDLRESGAIEQNADSVILLWNPNPKERTLTEAVIAKSRHGPLADVQLVFSPQWTRFESAAKIDVDAMEDAQTKMPYEDSP